MSRNPNFLGVELDVFKFNMNQFKQYSRTEI